MDFTILVFGIICLLMLLAYKDSKLNDRIIELNNTINGMEKRLESLMISKRKEED